MLILVLNQCGDLGGSSGGESGTDTSTVRKHDHKHRNRAEFIGMLKLSTAF